MKDLNETHAEVAAKRDIVSPIFQASLILLSFAILSFGFFTRLAYFRSLDQIVEIQPVTPKKHREFGGYSEPIVVGLEIEQFQTFDIKKNDFLFGGNIWFEFDAGTISLEALSDFAFQRATIVYLSKPETRLIGNRLQVRYAIKINFNSGLVYRDFPFDDHRVSLVLTHPFISPDEILFEAKATNIVVLSDLLPFGWQMTGSGSRTGYIDAPLSQISNTDMIEQPVVVFELEVSRYGSRHAIAILLPIFLMYSLMFFCLSVDYNPAVAIALGGITGMIAYRYVIEQLSPVSGDLMLSDRFFFLFLISGLLIFLLNQIDLFVSRFTNKSKRIAIAAIHLFTIICSAILLAP